MSVESKEKKDVIHNKSFIRYFRFGMIDNGLLLVSLLAGLSIDNFIATKIGVRGYGPLIGAVVGNSISDGIAAAPEGRKAAIGALAGSFTPCIPPIISLFLRVPLEKKAKVISGAFAMGCVAFGFILAQKYKLDDDE